MALVTAKTLFVHVPKTGGTSVRSMIAAAGIACRESGDFDIERHYGIGELAAAHGDVVQTRLTFGFVRNPVSWYKSRWAWAVVTGLPSIAMGKPSAARHWMMGCWAPTFAAFAANAIERYPGVATQTMFRMLGLWQSPCVTEVCRTETLEEDLIDVLDTAGERFDKKKMMDCPREHVAACGELASRTDVSRELKNRIEAAEPLLMQRFY
jgi:hypothetical protein